MKMDMEAAERIRRNARALARDLDYYADKGSENAINLLKHLEHLGEEIDNVIETFGETQEEMDF
jgi:hypothetical protein